MQHVQEGDSERYRPWHVWVLEEKGAEGFKGEEWLGKATEGRRSSLWISEERGPAYAGRFSSAEANTGKSEAPPPGSP